MKRFVLTRLALADLKSVARFTEKNWGRLQRDTYLKEIDTIFHALASNPRMGRACDDVRQGYRKLPHGAHIVYYRVMDREQVLIVRILHATMDVDSQLA